MAKRDYYEVLGVQRAANEQDLKSAFRKSATAPALMRYASSSCDSQ